MSGNVELKTPLMGQVPSSDAGAAPAPEVKLPGNLKPPTPGQLRMYNFEYYFTTDPMAKPVCIIAANLICVAILSILFWITNCVHDLSGTHRFLETLWMAFGKMGGGGGHSPNGYLWPTRFVLILSGFLKMGSFSLLVNFLGDAIDSKLEAIFEGSSRVLENDFVLILGWNDKILPLVDQLTLANESAGGKAIVVMADILSKPEMDDVFNENLEEKRGSTIVTRGGSPINPNDLEFVAAPIASSIIVLSQGFDPDEADAQAARAVLAVTGGMTYPAQGHCVIELRDSDNVPVVRLGISDKLSKRDKDRKVLPLVGANLIGRLMVQCSVEPGLARVFDHILAFEGNEFYFSQWSELQGKRFADACFLFDDAILIGIVTENPQDEHGNEDPNGSCIKLNPPPETLIHASDTLIFIAEDDDTYYPNLSRGFPDVVGICPTTVDPPDTPIKTMLIGWRRDMHEMVFEVDKWVAPGSELHIMTDKIAIEDRDSELAEGDWDASKTPNIVLKQHHASPILRYDLQAAHLETFHAVLVLTEEEEGKEGIRSDSKSMVTMLLCRDIQRELKAEAQLGRKPVLISEILDPRTADLVAIASADDFMVSNKMVSMALGQMSQSINCHPLVEELFNPAGMEMHIKPINLFAEPGERCTFWTIAGRARTRLCIAIGYTSDGEGLVINPADKSEPRLWQPNDRIVVISED
jgi:hypothetical protein